MKIIVLMGSPNRKGSTNILIENFVKGAEEPAVHKFDYENHRFSISLISYGQF